MKSGEKHSDEARAKIAAKNQTRMTAEERAKISRDTKLRMADPSVRQRIRDGMRAATGEAVELQTLRAVWLAARPAARQRFLAELTNADALIARSDLREFF
jgi:hypothetical protein